MNAAHIFAMVGAFTTFVLALFGTLWWATRSAAVAAGIVGGSVAGVGLVFGLIWFWTWVADAVYGGVL